MATWILGIVQCSSAETLESARGTSCAEPYADDEEHLNSPPYAECFGCHRLVLLTEFEGANDLPQCPAKPGTSTERRDSFTVDGLPCGSCSADEGPCQLSVEPLCDFDGDGPEPSEQRREYDDRWICQCEGGSWACRALDTSPAACFPAID